VVESGKELAVKQWLAWMATAAAVGASSGLAAADWNEWRGPQRNGLVEQSPSLAATWPEAGPTKVWESEEKLPPSTDNGGGWGSVVVADGRVYCLVILGRSEPLATRTLSESGLAGLGWTRMKPPADLLAKVEAARLSDERTPLKQGKELQTWVQTWVQTNLDTDGRKKFGSFIADRLTRGKAALEFKALDALETVKDKEFADEAALTAWLDQNGLQGEARKLVLARIPKTVAVLDSEVLCLDAATGKTLWKQVFGNTHPEGVLPSGDRIPSSTPCVVNGKCYVAGVDGTLFCLDAKTGAKVWAERANPGRHSLHSSPVVVDGVAVIAAGPLAGFDAETGKRLWTQDKVKLTNASPARWVKDGRTSLIVRGLHCVDPKTGDVLWSLSDGANDGTPAVVGDQMALWNAFGLKFYTLARAKPELIWQVKCEPDYGASPTIYAGHVYALGQRGAICVDATSGQVAWKEAGTAALLGSYASPIFADGKVLLQGSKENGGYGDGSLVLMKASAEKMQVLARARIAQTLCTSPAFTDGRLYCRLLNRIACYDLRAE
jgi:outer membrane protein assembly factor BamB